MIIGARAGGQNAFPHVRLGCSPRSTDRASTGRTGASCRVHPLRQPDELTTPAGCVSAPLGRSLFGEEPPCLRLLVLMLMNVAAGWCWKSWLGPMIPVTGGLMRRVGAAWTLGLLDSDTAVTGLGWVDAHAWRYRLALPGSLEGLHPRTSGSPPYSQVMRSGSRHRMLSASAPSTSCSCGARRRSSRDQ